MRKRRTWDDDPKTEGGMWVTLVMVDPPHQCHPPVILVGTGPQPGSEWACDCGIIWRLTNQLIGPGAALAWEKTPKVFRAG